MIDLVIHAGTKFALEQWLATRNLGTHTQDTDATSPTFGQWTYTHTAPGTFIWWRHPSGKLEKTFDNSNPEAPVVIFYAGFFGILRMPIEDMESLVAPWVRTSAATSIIDGFNGIGGEGITLIAPEEVNQHQIDISLNAPYGGIIGGMSWSDPRVWYLSPVMTNDEVEFNGTTYRSLIDFNVWSPTQYPAGWEEVASQPQIQPWVPPTGAQDAYNIGDQVSFNGQNYQSVINANVWSPAVYPAGWVVI